MDAGKLRHKILIQSPSPTQDTYGQPTQDWVDVLTTWSCLSILTSKEVYALGSGFTSQVTHKAVMRYPRGVTITADMRVVYGTRVFSIMAIQDPTELQAELDLLLLERTR